MLYNTQNPHGGDVYGAAVTLDFSSNVHPLGTPPGVVEAIRAAAAQVRQYPDPYCRALTAAIAAHEGVPQPYVLCGGGAAELSFTDDSDVLTSGIEIKVHPPGKIVTHIESLSGGEKALVAISIYFAIMRVNPPPFCVLDEIEAALDDVNVTRFAQYLRRMSRNSQFITITHRRGTMEEADVLYGVTMQDEGVSKLLELRASEIEAKLGMKA